MTAQSSLKAIVFISFAGLLFSGFLTYKELFSGSCDVGFTYCGTVVKSIGRMPACVYGFFMYLALFGISLSGYLKSKK